MSSKFPPCKLCGIDEASCKAHIIPRQFYRRVRGKSPHLLYLDSDPSSKWTTTQSGIYETGILCPKCDSKIGRYDNYAYKILPASPNESKFDYSGANFRLYELGNINVEKFQLFLVSLAWRAAVSAHPMFQCVKLGPYEQFFRNVLLGVNPQPPRTVTAVVILFRPPKYDRVIFCPSRTKYDGVNVLQFYLPPWKLLLKVDRRDFAGPIGNYAISPDKTAFAPVQNFFSTGELRMLNDIKKR